ncbi:MAG: hypothetical protein K0S29_335 [Gammaproteobacteria bacterium]|jgi:putative glycosyltransferase|nr:hypothetical protein [Gammaproteobacteria bacterium]
MRLSIVTTLYHSEPYIVEFYKRISLAAQKISNNYEIIFVNDGSPDHSLEIALKLYQEDKRIKLIDLSRNFGHHKAIMTGLSYASGDYVLLIDIDLEERPEYLNLFWDTLQANPEYDVAYGSQIKRKGGLFEQFSGHFFYKFFNFFSEVKIPKNSVQLRLMTKRYVESFVKFREKEPAYGILAVLTGFKQMSIDIVKDSHSPTTYTLFRRFNALINTITTSTSRPLWLIFYTGAAITAASILLIIKLIISWLFGSPLEGWTSVMVTILFFGGITILFQGLIGIYLSKVFYEVKDRPYVVIKKRYLQED